MKGAVISPRVNPQKSTTYCPAVIFLFKAAMETP